ncbi:MAG: protoporphyrinogen oxidase [Candidatus Omnitrophota bacterium]
MMPKRVLIVGGGVSGLATAYYLRELSQNNDIPLDLTVLEQEPRLGGVIRTQHENGYLFEWGPDSFAAEPPQTLELCAKLGLEDELIGIPSGQRKVYMLDRNRLHRIPSSFYLIAPSNIRALLELPFISFSGKLRMALELLIPARRDQSDESLGDFVRRRFGREAMEKLAQPFLGNIYGGDICEISLRATLARFHEMETKYGSMIRAAAAFFANRSKAEGPIARIKKEKGIFLSFRRGMQTLTDALVDRMPDIRWVTGMRLERLRCGDEWTATLDDGRTLSADAVCLAVSSKRVAMLLAEDHPLLAKELDSIPFRSMISVHLGFGPDAADPLPPGSGFLVAAKNLSQVMGGSFSGQKFEGRAPAGRTLIRAFIGREHCDLLRDLPGEKIGSRVFEEIRAAFGLHRPPEAVHTAVHVQSMPQYRVGHLDLLQRLEEAVRKIPGLFLTGNSYRGVGVPGCVQRAEEAARRIWQEIGAVEKAVI